MNIRKKSHLFHYFLLLIAHSSLLLYTLSKNKDRKRLLVLLASNIGLAYLFEYFVVNLFRGYRYKPGIFKNNSLDKISGAVLSQAIYVPFTAVFITSFRLNWKYKILISLYFGAIETLYVRLGIYIQRWWKTVYTIILLPIYFSISDNWYEQLKKRNPVILFFSFYHLVMVTCVNLLFVKATKKVLKFGRGGYHTWREHFIIVPIYSIVLSFYTAWQLQQKNKSFWFGKILGFRLLVDYILKQNSWLKLRRKNEKSYTFYHIFITLLAKFYQDLVYRQI